MLHIYYISVTYMSLQVNTLLNRKQIANHNGENKEKINLLTVEIKKQGCTLSALFCFICSA